MLIYFEICTVVQSLLAEFGMDPHQLDRSLPEPPGFGDLLASPGLQLLFPDLRKQCYSQVMELQMTLLIDRQGQKGAGSLRCWLHLTQWLR